MACRVRLSSYLINQSINQSNLVFVKCRLNKVLRGAVPQEGGGLDRARTSVLRVRRCLWHQSSDEAPACVEETVVTKERFCFVFVELYTCHSMKIHKMHDLSSINHLYRSKYRSKFIASSSLFNATYVSSVV